MRGWHPVIAERDGTGSAEARVFVGIARDALERATKAKRHTWSQVLEVAHAEVQIATEPEALCRALEHLAILCRAWRLDVLDRFGTCAHPRCGENAVFRYGEVTRRRTKPLLAACEKHDRWARKQLGVKAKASR